MFDEDPTKTPITGFKNLESMSIEEIEDYIEALKAEITKAEQDIKQKKASSAAAEKFFT